MDEVKDVFRQNQLLGRGVNIIGYDALWQSREKARMQDKHFRLIREAGFDHVRINLHLFKFMDNGPGHRFSPAFLDTLDWAIDQALENGLGAILDLHEFISMGDDPTGLKSKFLAAWTQLASRYQDRPESVYFELLNEPNKALTPELWNEYLKEAHEIIRETNPERTLIIGPGFWNGIGELGSLRLPEDDRQIIATVHYYHPMPFTHQGAAWSDHRDKVGVEWLGTPEEQQAVIDDLNKAQVWAEAKKRPILLGEFGAYDKGDMASRTRYTSFVSRQAERLGWSWSYWQFDSDFIVYDIDKDRWVTPILNALIPPKP